MNIVPTYGSPRSRSTKGFAWLAATMLIIMSLTQLYGFEDQPTILGVLLPFNDQPLATAVAALIVLAQILALPYLLGMYISRLMRLLCALACGFVSLLWLLLAFTSAHAENSGLFSTTADVGGGILPALWSLVLFACFVRVALADSKFRHDASS